MTYLFVTGKLVPPWEVSQTFCDSDGNCIPFGPYLAVLRWDNPQ